VCSRLYYLGSCKYNLRRSHIDEIAWWHISQNISLSLSNTWPYNEIFSIFVCWCADMKCVSFNNVWTLVMSGYPCHLRHTVRLLRPVSKSGCTVCYFCCCPEHCSCRGVSGQTQGFCVLKVVCLPSFVGWVILCGLSVAVISWTVHGLLAYSPFSKGGIVTTWGHCVSCELTICSMFLH